MSPISAYTMYMKMMISCVIYMQALLVYHKFDQGKLIGLLLGDVVLVPCLCWCVILIVISSGHIPFLFFISVSISDLL